MPVDLSPILWWVVGVVIIYVRIRRGYIYDEATTSDSPLKWSRVILPVLLGALAWLVAGISFEFVLEREYWPASGILAASIFSLIFIWVSAKRTIKPDGLLCIHCGYDLRATPARCPECGIIPPPVKV